MVHKHVLIDIGFQTSSGFAETADGGVGTKLFEILESNMYKIFLYESNKSFRNVILISWKSIIYAMITFAFAQ